MNTGRYVCGIYSDGTGPNPTAFQSPNAIQRTTVNSVSSNTGSINRALYISNNTQFSVRDAVFYATGPTGSNAIGVETSGTGSYLVLKTSTICGVTGDIKQPSLSLTGTNPVIQLSSTDLQNKIAINGFASTIYPSQLSYSISTNVKSASYYLLPINYTVESHIPHNIIGILLPQKSIIFSLSCMTYTQTGTNIYGTISLYNSTSQTSLTSATPFLTFTIPDQTTFSQTYKNFTSTINIDVPNYLIINFVSSSNSNTSSTLNLNLSLY